jgi:hypothetical protein
MALMAATAAAFSLAHPSDSFGCTFEDVVNRIEKTDEQLSDEQSALWKKAEAVYLGRVAARRGDLNERHLEFAPMAKLKGRAPPPRVSHIARPINCIGYSWWVGEAAVVFASRAKTDSGSDGVAWTVLEALPPGRVRAARIFAALEMNNGPGSLLGAKPVATFDDPGAAEARVSAQMLKPPKGMNAPELAERLARQEKPPNWPLSRFGGKDGPIPTSEIMTSTSDHRELAFLYRTAEPGDRPWLVCRVDHGGKAITEVHRRANAWCYQQLGSSPIAPVRIYIPPLPRRD